jgi:DNA-binding transcriptional ArsR family regulator
VTHRDVYVAIADPVRRRLIELLLEGPQTAGDLAAAFSDISRPAVSRHLRILRECAVVAAERRGREQWYVLDLDVLRNLRAGWLARVTDNSLAGLRALRRTVESRP